MPRAMPAAMNYHVNQDEMKLLAYLHEHAAGFGRNYPHDPAAVQNALELDETTFARASSYLEQLGLVGIDAERIDTYANSELILKEIWLTGAGGNFMPNLENAPGVGRKVTVAVVGQAWKIGTDTLVRVASQLLTEIARSRGMIP